MIPERLRLVNFGAYAEETIDFSDLGPAVVLTGRTGAGKSTIVDALLYVRTGECRVSLDEQIRRGQIEMRVEEVFRHGGERYRVVRGRSRKGRGSSVFELYVWANDAWVPLSGKQAKLEAILGTDYELLTATSFSLQGQSGRFLSARPSERLAVTRRLLRLDAFGAYLQSARVELRAADAGNQQLLSDLRAVEQAVASAERAANDAEAVRVELETLAAAELALTGQLAAVDAALARAEDAERKRNGLVDAVSDAERDASAARDVVQRARTRLAQAQREASRLDEARAGAAGLCEAQRAEAAAADELAAARLALDEAERIEREQMSRASAALSRELELRLRVEAELAEIRRARAAAIERAQRALDDLRARERTDAERRAHQASLHARDRARATADLERANQRIAVLHEVPCRGEGAFARCWYLGDARRASEAMPSLTAALAQIPPDPPEPDPWEVSAEEEQALATLSAARAQLDADMPPPASAAAHEAARQAVAALGPARNADRERSALRTAQDRADRARRAATNLAGWPAVVAAAERAAATIGELRAEVDAALDAEQRATARLASSRAELEASSATAFDKLRQARTARWDELSHGRARTAELAVRLGQLRAEADRHSTAVADVARIGAEATEQADRIESLKLLVDVYQEIPVLVLETAIPAIEHTANERLAERRTGFHVRLVTEAKAKTTDAVRDTLDILVTDRRGYEAPYESFSGGEQFMLDLALREALGELLAARAGVQDPPMLAIDEGWGSLDPHFIRTCADALRNVIASGRFGLVLAVTHVQDLIDLFEHKLVVSGGADGSARIVRSSPLAAAA
jgi:exonuclease SbcC